MGADIGRHIFMEKAKLQLTLNCRQFLTVWGDRKN